MKTKYKKGDTAYYLLCNSQLVEIVEVEITGIREILQDGVIESVLYTFEEKEKTPISRNRVFGLMPGKGLFHSAESIIGELKRNRKVIIN